MPDSYPLDLITRMLGETKRYWSSRIYIDAVCQRSLISLISSGDWILSSWTLLLSLVGHIIEVLFGIGCLEELYDSVKSTSQRRKHPPMCHARRVLEDMR
jgi:hypothetical protein